MASPLSHPQKKILEDEGMQQQDLSPSRNREAVIFGHISIQRPTEPQIYVHIAKYCGSVFWADAM